MDFQKISTSHVTWHSEHAGDVKGPHVTCIACVGSHLLKFIIMHGELLTLVKQFCSLTLPKFLSFPSGLPAPTIQEFLIQAILLNPHIQKYPPARQYQKSFWKWFISNLECILTDEVCATNFSVSFFQFSTCELKDEMSPLILDHYLSLLPPSLMCVAHERLRLKCLLNDQVAVLALHLLPSGIKYVREGCQSRIVHHPSPSLHISGIHLPSSYRTRMI